MERGKNDLDELTREIDRIINDNRKFLDRVMDDDFELEEGETEEEEEVVEEL